MALYKTKLIATGIGENSIIRLTNVNLTNIQLGAPSEEKDWTVLERFNDLDLSETILTKSSCIHCVLRHSDFSYAIMKEIDFRHAEIINTLFYLNDLFKANFSDARCTEVTFHVAEIRQASFRKFTCEKCVIKFTNFSETDLREAYFSDFNKRNRSIKMIYICFNHSDLFQTKFNYLVFNSITFIHNNMIQYQFLNCKFLGTSYMLNNSLINAIIKNFSFSSVVFDNVSFSNAYLERNIFRNVSFINYDMHGTSLYGSIFYNTSFINCTVDDKQLSLATVLGESILPNGTMIQ